MFKLAMIGFLWAGISLFLGIPTWGGTIASMPLRVKMPLEEGKDTTLDWGLRYDGLDLKFHGYYPSWDHRMRLDYFQPITKDWDCQFWGIIKKEGNYSYNDLGFRTRWEFESFYSSWQWTQQNRKPLASARSSGYESEEGLWRCMLKHGEHRWSLNLKRSVKDYDLGDDDSWRHEIAAGWQWARKHRRLELQWQEWTREYPLNATGNALADKISLRWRQLGDAGRVWELKGEWREELTGTGKTTTQWRTDCYFVQPLWGGTLRWGGIWTGNSKGVELLEWDKWTNTYQLDFRWRQTLGHRRSWWIGGELDLADEKDARWKMKAQWDWPIKTVGARFQITADYRDGDWDAGGYLQMAYYF